MPEAAEALAIALGATVNDDLTYEAGVAPGTLTPTATSDQLLELARARVPRPMTDEECSFYLHLEACPQRARELSRRTVVPVVTGDTEEVARARLERAGFGMRVAAT